MQSFSTKKYINVFLCLGSNVGNRASNLHDAIGLLEKNVGKVAKKSHVYETQPWGEPNQDLFMNQVVMLNTTLEPRELLDKISRIERELGRERKEKWGPRVIDIDILFYGKRVIRDKGLEIPHPELHKRQFVLVPMIEIAPEFVHPVLHKDMLNLFEICEDTSDVMMMDY